MSGLFRSLENIWYNRPGLSRPPHRRVGGQVGGGLSDIAVLLPTGTRLLACQKIDNTTGAN